MKITLKMSPFNISDLRIAHWFEKKTFCHDIPCTLILDRLTNILWQAGVIIEKVSS